VAAPFVARLSRPLPWAGKSSLKKLGHGHGRAIRASFGTATAAGARFGRRLGQPPLWAGNSGVVETGHEHAGVIWSPFELSIGTGGNLAPTSEVGAECTRWLEVVAVVTDAF
jgi:hypothetical protein